MHDGDEDNGDGDWRENRRLVAANFRRLFNAVDQVIEKLDEHSEDDRKRFEAHQDEIASLKQSAKAWGAVAGFIASIVSALLIWALTKEIKP